jgi:hypothetical protein
MTAMRVGQSSGEKSTWNMGRERLACPKGIDPEACARGAPGARLREASGAGEANRAGENGRIARIGSESFTGRARMTVGRHGMRMTSDEERAALRSQARYYG